MKHITKEYGQSTNLLELTQDEYKALEPFLVALGVRSRATMWMGETVKIQAENPYKEWISREDRSFADEAMSERGMSFYKQ